MSILVVADHDNTELKQASRVVIAAAQALSEHGGGDIDVLVAGSDCEAVANAASQVPGVSRVLHADNAAYQSALPENISHLVAALADGYDFILTGHTTTGKNFLPRVAAALDVQMISDIIGVDSLDTFKRPIYAGNAIATVKSSDLKKVISVRGTAYDAVAPEGGSASIESVDAVHDAGVSEFISEELAKSERPELTAAGVIISGGRGMQSGDNFTLLEGIADKLGAAIGASRAAVDAGFVPNDMQVGQTGKIVAPELYIAVGISGAIQHLAGMKDSKVIVAINKDEDAPIFQVADYGLVADLFNALPEFEEALG
ncbi:MAG: FAD-binding protein [Gammaproteobacteria bacterium]|nr:FAD-binding protein [Gammaproteobacteria bacterium]